MSIGLGNVQRSISSDGFIATQRNLEGSANQSSQLASILPLVVIAPGAKFRMQHTLDALVE